jgi:hypothetical protein
MLAGSACSSTLGDARTAYDEGRYPDAIRGFEAAELEARGWGEAGFADYTLERGLCHLALGDAREADRWLSHARRTLEKRPELFDAIERGRLESAWRSMGRMPGELR